PLRLFQRIRTKNTSATSLGEHANGSITFSLLMTARLITPHNAREKPARKSSFTIKTAVRAKHSRQDWSIGSVRRIRREADKIDKSPGLSFSFLTVNIFQKRSIGFY